MMSGLLMSGTSCPPQCALPALSGAVFVSSTFAQLIAATGLLIRPVPLGPAKLHACRFHQQLAASTQLPRLEPLSSVPAAQQPLPSLAVVTNATNRGHCHVHNEIR